MLRSSWQRGFCDSRLIDSERKFEHLAGLLGRPVASLQLTRLFSTRDSGWNATAFHAACDGRGPTITFVQASHGSYYGGFTSLSWTSAAQCHDDPTAFLFRCKYPEAGQQPEKFLPTGRGGEVHHSAGYGPTFGLNDAFCSFWGRDSILRETDHISFQIKGSLVDTAVARNSQHFQLEVLLVTACSNPNPALAEVQQPWRREVSWDVEDCTTSWKQLRDFQPAQQGCQVPHINILLCGGVGAGKSSIVCTLDGLCKGRASEKAPHGTGTGSLTRLLNKYTFKHPDTAQPLKFQLWDTMGWGLNDYKRGELDLILDGNLPNGCDLDKTLSHNTPGFKSSPGLRDQVHCVCFVVPCDTATDNTYMQRFREMRDIVRRKTKVRWCILLTKPDLYDPDLVGKDIKKTFYSTRLQTLVEGLQESSGVGGQKNIHPVQNLSTESMVSPEAGMLLCRALYAALNAATDALEGGTAMVAESASSAYTPSQGEQQAIANCNVGGEHGMLALKKDELYWVKPSAAEGAWLPAHDGLGNNGLVLERMVTVLPVGSVSTASGLQ